MKTKVGLLKFIKIYITLCQTLSIISNMSQYRVSGLELRLVLKMLNLNIIACCSDLQLYYPIHFVQVWLESFEMDINAHCTMCATH